jgi:hypothetical protein
MATLGKKSLRQRDTCKEPLRRFINALVIKVTKANDPLVKDIMIFQGLRSKADQNKDFAAGTSKLRWAKSYHNNPKLEVIPDDISTLKEEDKSSAADILPYPQMWDSEEAFAHLKKMGNEVLKELGLQDQIHNGMDLWGWDEPHWQLKR